MDVMQMKVRREDRGRYREAPPPPIYSPIYNAPAPPVKKPKAVQEKPYSGWNHLFED